MARTRSVPSGASTSDAQYRRPMPPPVLQGPAPLFVPAPDLEAWARCCFIDAGGPLANPDHEHLAVAHLGFLWTNVPSSRHGQRVVGMAEMPRFEGGPWVKARQEQQMAEWFGDVPDFVITVDALVVAEMDDTGFCALIEHELYHCGRALDRFGAPRFDRNGRPLFAVRGHDVEELVAVVARYGASAGAGRTADLVVAAGRPALLSPARVKAACGDS